METNKIMAAVCKAVQLNAEKIEKLSQAFEVEVSDKVINDALDFCGSKGNFSTFNEIIVRSIFMTVVERYKKDLGEKFKWNPACDNPYIEYDGERVVSDMQLRGIVREIKEKKQYIQQLKAPREFHLTEEDKKILLAWGNKEEDLDQIELEANVCEYTQCYKSKPDRKITREEAIKILGREEWLSGIDRTAFHNNCGRSNGNRYVHFESGIVGRSINKFNYQ